MAWMQPSQFLGLHDEQHLSFLPPQYYQLSILAGMQHIAAVKGALEELDEDQVSAWQPVGIEPVEGGTGMCYPGDALYPAELNPSQSPAPYDRHRIYMTKQAAKAGSAGGKGMPENTILAGVNKYELERNVPIAFGGESWGGHRRANIKPKL